jgi:hypothetical protein
LSTLHGADGGTTIIIHALTQLFKFLDHVRMLLPLVFDVLENARRATCEGGTSSNVGFLGETAAFGTHAEPERKHNDGGGNNADNRAGRQSQPLLR